MKLRGLVLVKSKGIERESWMLMNKDVINDDWFVRLGTWNVPPCTVMGQKKFRILCLNHTAYRKRVRKCIKIMSGTLMHNQKMKTISIQNLTLNTKRGEVRCSHSDKGIYHHMQHGNTKWGEFHRNNFFKSN